MTPDAWRDADPKHRDIARGRLRSGVYFCTTVRRWYPFAYHHGRTAEHTGTGTTQEMADREAMRMTEPALMRLALMPSLFDLEAAS